MDKRRSGVSRFSVEKGFASQYRTFRRGTFLCCVSEKFWYRKRLGMREGAGITTFCQNCFVLQYRKTTYGNPSVLNKSSIVEKFMDKRGGEEEGSITIFCEKFFVSQCRKISQRNPSVLCFRNFPLAKKVTDKRRGAAYQIFPSETCFLTAPKI